MKFDWKELHGKKLKINVGRDFDEGVETICVMGYEKSTGRFYALHSETGVFR